MGRKADATRSLTRSKRRRDEDPRSEKATLLLEATERLLARGQSFIELSVEALCREAGIGRSTYYVYFRDKGHLLRELTGRLTGEMLEGSQSWWDVASHATREELRQAMLETVKVYRRHQAIFVALTQTANYDREADEAWESLITAYTQRALEAMQAGKQAGIVRDDVDEPTVRALIWMCERVSYRLARGDDEHLEQAAELIAKILWRTLYKDSEKAAPARQRAERRAGNGRSG